MPIKRLKKVSNFTMVHNNIINDPQLSFKAKGIMLVLLSKPDSWVIRIGNIVSHSNDGEKSTRSGFKELMQSGYITRERIRDDNGTFLETVYTVHEEPTNQDSTSLPFRQCGELEPETPNFQAQTADKPHSHYPHVQNGDVVIYNSSNINNTAARRSNLERVSENSHKENKTNFAAADVFISDKLTENQLHFLEQSLNDHDYLTVGQDLIKTKQIIIDEILDSSSFTHAADDFKKKVNTVFKAWRDKKWSPWEAKKNENQKKEHQLKAKLREQMQDKQWIITKLKEDINDNLKASLEKSLEFVDNVIKDIGLELESVSHV